MTVGIIIILYSNKLKLSILTINRNDFYETFHVIQIFEISFIKKKTLTQTHLFDLFESTL